MTASNRLAQETSPYLRQHKDNPVDWYPWGPEAFAAAAERSVPILLSVGANILAAMIVAATSSAAVRKTALQR